MQIWFLSHPKKSAFTICLVVVFGLKQHKTSTTGKFDPLPKCNLDCGVSYSLKENWKKNLEKHFLSSIVILTDGQLFWQASGNWKTVCLDVTIDWLFSGPMSVFHLNVLIFGSWDWCGFVSWKVFIFSEVTNMLQESYWNFSLVHFCCLHLNFFMF